MQHRPDMTDRSQKHWRLHVAACLVALGLLSHSPRGHAQAKPEYQLKAAFLYNFALFTEWPADTGPALNLCIYGSDPFGGEVDALAGKPVGTRVLAIRRTPAGGSLEDCQIVFIAPANISGLANVLERLQGSAALTVADSPGAARRGVALNMSVSLNKVAFEANLSAARSARLNLSSKLLRLATVVIQ
jgi:hypothetical protein